MGGAKPVTFFIISYEVAFPADEHPPSRSLVGSSRLHPLMNFSPGLQRIRAGEKGKQLSQRWGWWVTKWRGTKKKGRMAAP